MLSRFEKAIKSRCSFHVFLMSIGRDKKKTLWHFCCDLVLADGCKPVCERNTEINTRGTKKSIERRIVEGKKDLKYLHWNFCVL